MELLKNLKSHPVSAKNLNKEEMGNKTVLRSLLIELRPRLCSGNVLLQTARPLSKVEVFSDSSCVFLAIVGVGWSGVVVVNGPPRFSFVPSGFRIDDSSITFSVVFEPLDKRLGSSTAEVLEITHGDNVTKNSKNKFSVPEFPCQPKCRVCDSSVWKEWWKFERVLALPSTPLEEVVGEWFCHGHSDSHTLVTRPTDCYHDNLSTLFCLKNVSPGVVSCGKCRAWLGTVDKCNMCRLWGCTVKWECEDSSPWLELPTSPLEAFLEAVKQTSSEEGPLKPIHKLSIETQLSDEERRWLILFVVNGDLKLLLPFAEEGDSKDGFLDCEESPGKLDVGWHVALTDFLTEEDVKKVMEYWKCNCEQLPFKVNLSSKLMKKVLFKEEGVSGIKRWVNQADVVSIKIAAPMFTAGLNHLKQANQLLPRVQRVSEEFEVSYLAL